MVSERRDEDKKKARIDIQARIVDIYKSSKFIPDEVRMKKMNLKILSHMNTASKLGPHTQTDRGTCPGVGL